MPTLKKVCRCAECGRAVERIRGKKKYLCTECDEKYDKYREWVRENKEKKEQEESRVRSILRTVHPDIEWRE